jgi:hypothetical protein
MGGLFASGATAYVSMSPGGAAAVNSGGFTIMSLFRNDNSPSAGPMGPFSSFASTTVGRLLLSDYPLFGLNDFSAGFGPIATGTWYVGGMSKPTANAHPPAGGDPTGIYRYHLWPYDSSGAGTMAHGVTTGSQHDDGAVATTFRIGDDGVGDKSKGALSVVGLWTSVLSDANIDTLKSGFLTAWSALSPQALITMDQWNGATGCNDVVGTCAQTALTGTIGATADAPSFNFALGPSGSPRNGDSFLAMI